MFINDKAKRLHLPCIHRGPILRQQKGSCGCSKVNAVVFACEKHHECTVSVMLKGVKSCFFCPDYVPKPEQPCPPKTV